MRSAHPPPISGRCEYDVSASEITYLGVGGPLSTVVWPKRIVDVLRILRWAARHHTPWIVLGAGSNVLVLREGFRGVAIVVTRLLGVARTLRGISSTAGMPTTTLSRLACRWGLQGLEFAAGLPGTIGGAVAMNARAYGGEMSQVVAAVLAADGAGRPVVLRPRDLGFGYKRSLLQERTLCALKIYTRLGRGSPIDLLSRSREILARRRQSGQYDQPSAGCFFRNPPAPLPPAGKLLDDAGMRGHRCGGAQLSERHANILVIAGDATVSDVLSLATVAAQRVAERSGVLLRTEVKLLGRNGWVDPLFCASALP